MLSQRVGILIIGVLATATFWLCRRYFQLRGIPGPFVARITNLCRVRWVGSRKSHEIHSRLHDQYGSVVRFGPNMVSVADPAAISVIYPARSGFLKGDFYHVFKSPDEPPDVFTAQDEGIHKTLRAPVAPYYSFSKLQSLETAIDNNIDRLFHQLDRKDSGDSTSLTTWLQAFAFDTVWAWMFTNPYGMLEMGSTEEKKTLESNWEIFQIIGPLSQSSTLRNLAGIINAILTALKIDSIPQLHKHTVSLIKSREEQFESSSEELNASDNVDMMTQLLLMKSKNSMIPPWTVSSLSLLNVFAGSDSTAVVMGTMWHNLLLHRDSMQCLYNELLEHEAQGSLTRPVPKWKEVRGLAYLDACLNEALRLHPPFCLPFERVVPDTGLSIGDYYLPPGTLVGMSPYVVGRYKPVFGQDADQWRPERWLECSPQDQRKMESSMITFGAGRRVCLGKNVAIMEIKKLIPAILLRYDIKLLDPTSFKVENSWFFRQEGLDVEMKKRDGSA
uniref:Cytochrome P450 monooxygenase esdpH n=1 Tax=Penicillium shearii TaxID=904690 RepID=ESDPH_PENSH|nr:cytochrome P450 oxidase [Penicillium shearii]